MSRLTKDDITWLEAHTRYGRDDLLDLFKGRGTEPNREERNTKIDNSLAKEESVKDTNYCFFNEILVGIEMAPSGKESKRLNTIDQLSWFLNAFFFFSTFCFRRPL